MKPETFELMKTAARTLLAHQAAGRHCDPESVTWAQQLLAQNPRPLAAPITTETNAEEQTT